MYSHKDNSVKTHILEHEEPLTITLRKLDNIGSVHEQQAKDSWIDYLVATL